MRHGEGGGEYTHRAGRARPARGTEVTLHLREGEDELLDDYRLRTIIRKYSDHIAIPIVMKKAGRAKGERDASTRRARCGRGRRARSRDEQYIEFYKHVGARLRAAARVDAQPRRGPAGIHAAPLHPGARAVRPVGPRASPRPQALRAARLHHGRRRAAAARVPALRARRRRLRRPAAQRLARDPAAEPRRRRDPRRLHASACSTCSRTSPRTRRRSTPTFWKEFGRVLKEGVGEDTANRERIAKLLRFASTHDDSEEQTVSLADYVARMKEGQDKIYYVTAETFRAAKNSPHLEIFRKRGIEVLLLHDRIDEWLVGEPHRIRGQAARVGGARRARSRQARDRATRRRSRTAKSGEHADARREAEERARRQGEGRARHARASPSRRRASSPTSTTWAATSRAC